MATTAREAGPHRHPWLEVLRADPDVAISDLLSGYARIEPYGRAEVPDAARMLFGPVPADDELRLAFDKAVLKWLDNHRLQGVPDRQPPTLERELREIADAFRLISVLFLPAAMADMRKRFILWNSWIEQLLVDPTVDVRATFLSMLALTQRSVSQTAEFNPFALEPLWLTICEQAGSEYPETYLSIGLLGLRLLPEREDTPNERPWMAGLAGWAASQQPSDDAFTDLWRSLKALYPRAARHWRRAIADMIEQPALKSMPIRLLNIWKSDVGFSDADRARARVVEPPPKHKLVSLLAKIGEPFNRISSEILQVVRNYEQFAEATGDSYFLVTSACNIGMRLIDVDDDFVDRGKLGSRLALKALAWQSSNVFAWALWRDALAAQQEYEAAENVGWETIRRFPNNVQWRNQLSELLISIDRVEDAAAITRESLDRGIEDAATFDLQARLAFHLEGIERAQSILNEGLSRFPDGPALQRHMSALQRGESLPLQSAAFRERVHGVTPQRVKAAVSDAVARGGKLRRIGTMLLEKGSDANWRQSSLEQVERILSEDPNLSYGRYLLSELGRETDLVRNGTNDTFAIKFVDAIRRKDNEQLRTLEETHGNEVQFLDLARAYLFGDTGAAEKTTAWLRSGAQAEARSVASLRRFIEMRVRSKWGDADKFITGEMIIELVAANDNVRMDLVESVFVPNDFLLAA